MPHLYTSKYHFSPLNYTIGSDRPLRKTIYVFFEKLRDPVAIWGVTPKNRRFRTLATVVNTN